MKCFQIDHKIVYTFRAASHFKQAIFGRLIGKIWSTFVIKHTHVCEKETGSVTIFIKFPFPEISVALWITFPFPESVLQASPEGKINTPMPFSMLSKERQRRGNRCLQ